VERTKATNGGFDKKLMEGLMFMQTYINKNASFHPIKLGTTLKPIKEKDNFPKFQVTSQSYFCVPGTRAFNNIDAEARCTIRGSAIMGFTEKPEQCLEEAAGDLCAMGCAIFYKKMSGGRHHHVTNPHRCAQYDRRGNNQADVG
jgi:hypothetical protein